MLIQLYHNFFLNVLIIGKCNDIIFNILYDENVDGDDEQTYYMIIVISDYQF